MTQRVSLAIEGELTIYRAQEIQQQLVGALSAQPPALDIDLSAVTELDSAGVQLLMAAKRAADAAGFSLSLLAHSEAVVEVFGLFNLAAFFDDPLVVPG